MSPRTKKRKRKQSEVIKFTQEYRDYIRAYKEHLDESDAEAQRIARVRKKAGTPAHTQSALMEQRLALLEEKADTRTRRRHFAAQHSSHTGDKHPEPTEKEYSSAKPVDTGAMVKLIQKCIAKLGTEPKGGWTNAARQARKKSRASEYSTEYRQLIDDERLAGKCDSVDLNKAGRIGGRRKRRRRTRRRRRKSRRRTKRRRRTRRRRRRRHYRGGATCSVGDSLKSIIKSPFRGAKNIGHAWENGAKKVYNSLTPGCPPACHF